MTHLERALHSGRCLWYGLVVSCVSVLSLGLNRHICTYIRKKFTLYNANMWGRSHLERALSVLKDDHVVAHELRVDLLDRGRLV